MSDAKLVTPTRLYCAAIRVPGLGWYAGSTSPTDVESPTWTSDVQDVCVGACGCRVVEAGRGVAAPALGGSGGVAGGARGGPGAPPPPPPARAGGPVAGV